MTEEECQEGCEGQVQRRRRRGKRRRISLGIDNQLRRILDIDIRRIITYFPIKIQALHVSMPIIVVVYLENRKNAKKGNWIVEE